MKIFAISDLHLSSAVKKPMDIFGDGWQNHFEKICADWRNKVDDGDLVLLGGDMSWGLTIEEAAPDYAEIAALPGNKVVVKGNHDYYWNSLNKMRTAFADFKFLQNNAYRFETQNSASGKTSGIVVAGTRGWTLPDASTEESDRKVYEHELLRLNFSLSEALKLKQDEDMLVVMLHYPPFGANYGDTQITCTLENANADKVLYGHLHGKNVRLTPKIIKNGIEYILTSCDLINNSLVTVAEI